MVYRRYYRRRRFMRRRTYRRRFRGIRKMRRYRRRSSYQKPLLVKLRWTEHTELEQNIYANGLVFRLNQIPNYTEYLNMFDQYRLNMVKIKWRFNGDAQSIQTLAAGSTVTIPQLHWVNDYTDVSSLTIANLREYQNYKMRPLQSNSPVTMLIRPKLLQPVGGGTNRVPVKRWLPVTASNEDHFGIKTIVDCSYANGIGGDVVGTLTKEFTYYFQFKITK